MSLVLVLLVVAGLVLLIGNVRAFNTSVERYDDLRWGNPFGVGHYFSIFSSAPGFAIIGAIVDHISGFGWNPA